jgi:xanthine dehydrogenase YagS FAD-binding subunit
VKEFTYTRATSTAGAVATWDTGARYLAGGTNLVDLMKLGVETPERLIDITRLGLDQIEETAEGGLRIGASVKNSDLAHHPATPQVLREALLAGASGQLRNVATVGGNLLQRTRCSYFQNTSKPCAKRHPGAGCPAIEGDHRNHAILGHRWSCVATHPSDMAVALVALGAAVETDRRTIDMPGLHRLPGDKPDQDTVLEPGELITHVTLPPTPGPSHYRKVRDRASYAFAVVSIAVAGDRVAFGGLAHIPWRATIAEEQRRNGATREEAIDAELAHAEPLRDNAFKVTLARNLYLAET